MVRNFIVTILAGAIILGLLTAQPAVGRWMDSQGAQPTDSQGEGCRKCHVDILYVHHELVSGLSCEYCHLVWDEYLGTYVWVDLSSCFSCHEGAHHGHSR
jgi:hypothetical protein